MTAKQIAVKKYVVKLSGEERERLGALIHVGKHPARLLTKARILLKADASEAGEAWSDSQIAEALDTSIDTVSHEWLIRFVEHRVGDRRVIRLIRKWLKAGVAEDGAIKPGAVGTPQGAVISPLLANIYYLPSLILRTISESMAPQ